MCTARSRRYIVIGSAFISVLLLGGCPPEDLTQDAGGFIVGGADGNNPGGTTGTGGHLSAAGGSIGIGGAGSTTAQLGTGSAGPGSFRLLSTANGRLVQLLINPPIVVPLSPANLGPAGLAVAPDGTVFALSNNVFGVPQLSTVSTTGTPTVIGTVNGLTTGVNQLGFAPNGTLFAGGNGSVLFSVDQATGQVTPVVNAQNLGAFAFGPNGMLVGSGVGGLQTFSINAGTATGVLATANQVPFAPFIRGMTFAPDGFIYTVSTRGFGQSDLARINPDTGVSVLLARYNTDLFGLAAQPE